MTLIGQPVKVSNATARKRVGLRTVHIPTGPVGVRSWSDS